jgi:hypothetical protein
MALINYNLCFDDEANKFVAVNSETGEIKDFVTPKKSTSTKTTSRKKKDESSEPQLILVENKYFLNTAAVELMGVEPEAKLNIKMRKIDKVMTPVIGTDEAFKVKSGNRLTKSFTVACRGANNEALAAYGNIFTLEENPDGTGTFILHGNKAPVVPEPDENLNEEEPLPEGLDVDLDTMEDDIPTEAEEIDGETFESMLQGLD